MEKFSFFWSFLAKMNKLQKRGPTCKQGQNKLSLGGVEKEAPPVAFFFRTPLQPMSFNANFA